MSRRGENIYKRKDGRWEARVPEGYKPNGQKKYRSIYGRSYSEVKEKIKTVPDKCLKSKDGKFASMAEEWIDYESSKIKVSSLNTYKASLEKHILPFLGNKYINAVSDSLIYEFCDCMRKNNLSDNYLSDMVRIIKSIIKYSNKKYGTNIAMPDGICKKSTQKHLPPMEDVRKLEKYLLQNLEDSTCRGIYLCAYTGIRIGELCALTWDDIDTKSARMYISHTMQRTRIEGSKKTEVVVGTPKTEQSKRIVPLSSKVNDVLLQEREKNGYVVKGKKYPYAEPRTIQSRFSSILKRLNIPVFNFHCLRHIFATRWLEQGKILQRYPLSWDMQIYKLPCRCMCIRQSSRNGT